VVPFAKRRGAPPGAKAVAGDTLAQQRPWWCVWNSGIRRPHKVPVIAHGVRETGRREILSIARSGQEARSRPNEIRQLATAVRSSRYLYSRAAVGEVSAESCRAPRQVGLTDPVCLTDGM
jgi:hypothetical protein